MSLKDWRPTEARLTQDRNTSVISGTTLGFHCDSDGRWVGLIRHPNRLENSWLAVPLPMEIDLEREGGAWPVLKRYMYKHIRVIGKIGPLDADEFYAAHRMSVFRVINPTQFSLI